MSTKEGDNPPAYSPRSAEVVDNVSNGDDTVDVTVANAVQVSWHSSLFIS